MTKNKLEKKFSESFKADTDFWGMKLHNNPLSHQNTPADYILDYINYGALNLMLVECKQVTCKEGKGRLAFKRLKQMHDLLVFEEGRPDLHKAFFCIAYYDGRWDNSEVYLVPVKFIRELIASHPMVSLNREDACIELAPCKTNIVNGFIDLKLLKE